MRTLLMALLAVGLVALLFAGMFGPIEIAIWLGLWIAWLLLLIKWARPRDRANQPQSNGAAS